MLESEEIVEDAVIDAIEANGEIHSFLKNPAIARGVVLDAVGGVPFIAWQEPTGRTLDRVIANVRQRSQQVPIEHALLIGEKVASALDHAYNTTVDGERTLHGLVWPGFVSVSDDGEIRLTGFGLAPGFASSLGKPRLAREVGPYLAPEQIASGQLQKNGDVFSVGVILFELLFGRLPTAQDRIADLRALTRELPQVTPELVSVLRRCLAPAAERFASSGDLRRELGKILFSGPYSPSTFNLAFFLHSLFAAEIDAETRDRAREIGLDPADVAEADDTRPAKIEAMAPHPPRGRAVSPMAGALGGILVIAAVAGTIALISSRQTSEASGHQSSPPRTLPTAALPTALPAASPAPSAAPDGQMREEVARRVAVELKKIETEMLRSQSPQGQALESASKDAAPALTLSASPLRHTPAPSSPTAAAKEPTAAATPEPAPSPLPGANRE